MINIVNKKNHKSTIYDYYIARPNPLGNPFTHKPNTKFGKIIVNNRKEAIENYEEWLKYKIIEKDEIILNELKKLINFYKEHGEINLVCWCKPESCHGDILKKFITGELFPEYSLFK